MPKRTRRVILIHDTGGVRRREPPPRYQQWLAHVFDRAVAEKAWHFDVDSETFEANDEEIVELFTWTMECCGSDLTRFSDAEVNQGLNYVFSNSCSNFTYAILDGKVALEAKLAALRSIKRLYSDCFAIRCDESLSHLNEPSHSALNSICYMLWDTTTLNYWEGRPERTDAYNAIVDALEEVLSLRHLGCVESALHGLGHTHAYSSARISRVIQGFITANPKLRPELLAYANNAAIGYVL